MRMLKMSAGGIVSGDVVTLPVAARAVNDPQIRLGALDAVLLQLRDCAHPASEELLGVQPREQLDLTLVLVV